jgi:hypothetical protein
MRRSLLFLTVLVLTAPASAATVKSAGSGNWSDPKTWEGGTLPAAGDAVVVREGHTVVYDVQSDAVIRAVFIVGTLTFAPDKDTELNVGLIRIQHDETLDENGFDCNVHPAENKPKTGTGPVGFTAGCLCCDGKPALLVGTPETPIAAGKRARIRLHYIEGMDKESCPAIVCCGGRMDFHGAAMSRTWVKLGAHAMAGNTGIVLAEPVTGWRVGDRLIVTSSSHPRYKQDKAEEVTITNITDTRIEVEPSLESDHLGEGDYRAEVANLSRNVIVESANPEGVRGHTMYHRGSAGSISYAEFRHLGKEGVLGRYSLHYHLCGDTMRGSSLIGVSIHHSKNRWLTVHGTNYLVVRDCVGYQSVGHGFFLEDGTEVYNVFDRNLACQALDGKPLPKQVLPFDANEGAGFWLANAHNTFTRNVAVECRQYGFRYEATPKAGVVPTDSALNPHLKYGEPDKPFDLVMDIRQADGSRKPVDIRTLPFIRFDDNETHSNGFWGLNLGLGAGGVGPDPDNPFVIRNLKIWSVIGGYAVEPPNVLIDGMTIHDVIYGVRASVYRNHDYRNVVMEAQGTPIATLEQYLAHRTANGNNRVRQPGWPRGNGDGGARHQSPEIEVARLDPIDKLPPITVITHVRKHGDELLVQGTTSDNGELRQVTVNGQKARLLDTYGSWEAVLQNIEPGAMVLSAEAEDVNGNVEITPHELTVVVR